MADDAERTEANWEAVHEEEECLDCDDTVNQASEKLFCEDSMFLDKFRKVV